jgi:hypothetical protein
MEIETLSNDEAARRIIGAVHDRLTRAGAHQITTSHPTPGGEAPEIVSCTKAGHEITISPGSGRRLVHGKATWRKRGDGDDDAPWEFHVDRETERTLALATKGGGVVQGSADDVVENIVSTFLREAR